MVLRKRQGEALPLHGQPGETGGVTVEDADEADVERTVEERLHLWKRLEASEGERNARPFLTELAHGVLDQPGAGGGDDEADRDGADLAACRLPADLLGLGRLLEHCARLREKALTHRGERDAPGLAIEELGAERRFEGTDLLAQGGCGDLQPFRRMSEMQLFGDRHEITKVPDFHAVDYSVQPNEGARPGE